MKTETHYAAKVIAMTDAELVKQHVMNTYHADLRRDTGNDAPYRHRIRLINAEIYSRITGE